MALRMKAPAGLPGLWFLAPISLERDVLQERNHPEDDHDNPRDLFGAAVQRQQVDQIKDENNDQKGNQRAHQHVDSPGMSRETGCSGRRPSPRTSINASGYRRFPLGNQLTNSARKIRITTFG